MLQRFFRRESALLRRRRAAVHVSEFTVLSCIGRGAFGEACILVPRSSSSSAVC